MRPCALSLTAPTETGCLPVVAALDTWVDRVACNGGGSSVLLVEGKGERKGTRHWHGMVLSWEPERTLTAWWCQDLRGATWEAQRIKSISTACLPLGSPGMEKDVRRVLEYAFKQHVGSEIVARGGLGTCWFQATAPPLEPEAAVPTPVGAEGVGEPMKAPAVRASTKRGTARRTASAGSTGTRCCEYCGGSLEGRRRDARHCGDSCRNMASRKRVKSKRRAA